MKYDVTVYGPGPLSTDFYATTEVHPYWDIDSDGLHVFQSVNGVEQEVLFVKEGHYVAVDVDTVEEDVLQVRYFRTADQPVTGGDNGVVLTHVPSGIQVACGLYRTQMENFRSVEKELRTRLTVAGD